MPEVITDNLDLWTSALLTKSTAGRGSNGKLEAYGIKKLRELILELAVRGKLVPQDPSDEPASVLLKKIGAEKERLINEGRLRAASLAKIGYEEIPYQSPDGWEWVRLGEYLYLEMGQSPSSKFYNQEMNGLPFFQGKADFGDIFPIARYWCTQPQKLSFPGDVLLSVRAPVGPTNISNIECCIGRGLAALRPLANASTQFLLILMRASQERLVSQSTGTTFAAVSKKDVESLVVCVPPLAEQHRIVAKVDELMALCDQLEQQQTHSLAAHQTLVETLLGTLTRVGSQQEFSEAWARIASHFDTLFTTEHSIDQLKQTILQLAVMGKLVPQDPNDEPASVLLKRIAERREELIEEGRLKKQNPIPDVTAEETRFELPPGWEFVRFGTVTFNRDAERVPLSVEERRGRQGEYDYYGASGVIDSIDDFLFDKPLLLIGEDGANLLNRSTPIGFMARGKYWVNNHAHVLDGLSEELLLYICLHINAINLEPYVTGTAQPKMNQAKMNTIVLALPPMGEQKRIVAKVDELMALCDALKARLTDAQTTQIHLADAIVEQAVA